MLMGTQVKLLVWFNIPIYCCNDTIIAIVYMQESLHEYLDQLIGRSKPIFIIWTFPYISPVAHCLTCQGIAVYTQKQYM